MDEIYNDRWYTPQELADLKAIFNIDKVAYYRRLIRNGQLPAKSTISIGEPKNKQGNRWAVQGKDVIEFINK